VRYRLVAEQLLRDRHGHDLRDIRHVMNGSQASRPFAIMSETDTTVVFRDG